MNENNEALNAEPEVQETEEQVTESESPAEEIVDSPEETEEVDRSAKSRIRELANERREEKQHVNSLKDQLNEFGLQDQWDQPMYEPKVEPGQELSVDQYKQDVLQTADSLVELKLRARDNGNRIKSEINDAVSEYTMLDPKQDSFDEDLSEGVTDSVRNFIKANPTGNVRGFIDKLMKPYQKSVEREVAKREGTVAKQVSQTALRPSQVKATSKKFEEMDLSEMEAKLGKVY